MARTVVRVEAEHKVYSFMHFGQGLCVVDESDIMDARSSQPMNSYFVYSV